MNNMHLADRYKQVRGQTNKLCEDLQPEDTVAQAEEFTSPPKWHLAHSTWFFETFVLKIHLKDYKEFNPDFHFLFNSYYNSLGERVARHKRGLLSRPLLSEVYKYRAYVDAQMELIFAGSLNKELSGTIELGLQHEQQHQELLVTDTKYMFAQNPLLPKWKPSLHNTLPTFKSEMNWLNLKEGIVTIGYDGKDFCFDNELGVHKQYLNGCMVADRPVTNGEFIDFIDSEGYTDFSFWLSEGWAWVTKMAVSEPLYWQKKEDIWYRFSFNGLETINPDEPIMHLNYYEADAFARWKGMRLPTEFEYETAAKLYPESFKPVLWEWTQSAYLPYPGFKTAEGAVGEYNGKFMINQMVLRGASIATPKDHSRVTYRNFFSPELRWQFSGIRLVKDLQ